MAITPPARPGSAGFASWAQAHPAEYAQWYRENQSTVDANYVGRTKVPGMTVSGPDLNGMAGQTAPRTADTSPGYLGAEGPKQSSPNPYPQVNADRWTAQQAHSPAAADWLGAEGPKQSLPNPATGTGHVGHPTPDVAPGVASDPAAEAAARRGAEARARLSAQKWADLGLTSALDIILGAQKDGYGANSAVVTERILKSQQYQHLYGGVQDALRKAGMRPLSPEEIMSARQSYASVLRRAGMPKGFYDDVTDFNRFIVGDISVDEVANRAALANSVVGESVPSETMQAFRKYYGISKGDLAAYFLDPQRAEPLLQERAKAAAVGGVAIDTGMNGAGRKFAESLVADGVDQASARAAFTGTVQDRARTAEVAGLDGVSGVNDRQSARARLGLDGATETRLKGLASRERARFGGSADATKAFETGLSGSF